MHLNDLFHLDSSSIRSIILRRSSRRRSIYMRSMRRGSISTIKNTIKAELRTGTGLHTCDSRWLRGSL
jgi:hypothetical protein